MGLSGFRAHSLARYCDKNKSTAGVNVTAINLHFSDTEPAGLFYRKILRYREHVGVFLLFLLGLNIGFLVSRSDAAVQLLSRKLFRDEY